MSTATLEPEAETMATTTPAADADAAHQEVIDLVRGRCLQVSFTVHNLPKSRRIRGRQADQVAASVGGSARGIRSSWALFSSKHPAVQELGQAIRALFQLRDSWTIVRSAEVQRDGEKVTIEGGKRLIWDADHVEFHNLVCAKAEAIDRAAAKVQQALDQPTAGAGGKSVPSIKEMDRQNAGSAWDAGAYPEDVANTVGVAKERLPDGRPKLDDQGRPVYLITFDEYHVSEKLSGVLRERAIARLDAGLSDTIGAAMRYAVNELNEDLTVFMHELADRLRIHPLPSHPWAKFCQHDRAEVVKAVTHEQEPAVPDGRVRVLLAYKDWPEGVAHRAENLATVRRWMESIPLAEYEAKVRPEASGDRRKIYPGVIEGIIAKMQAFRDKKARMLGDYGADACACFDDLFRQLTRLRGLHTSNDEAARKLAESLRGNAASRQDLAAEIADTVAALEEKVEAVQQVVRRRAVRSGLVGAGGD